MDKNSIPEEFDSQLKKAIQGAGIEKVADAEGFVLDVMTRIESIQAKEQKVKTFEPLISGKVWFMGGTIILLLILFLISPYSSSETGSFFNFNTEIFDRMIPSISVSKFFIYGMTSLVLFFVIEIIMISGYKKKQIEI